MKLSARVQASLDLLDKIAVSRVPMDATSGDFMRARRYIGAKDRAAIIERVYAVTRAKARLGWWLEQKQQPDTARRRQLAWLVLGEGITPDNLNALFDGSPHAPPVLDDDERAFAATLPPGGLDDPAMPDEVRAECPPAYAAALHQRFGDDFMAEMAAMLVPATLDIRVNASAGTKGAPAREAVQASLAQDGIETDLCALAPLGLRARTKAYLAHSKAFAKGWVDIQDEGSQLIALLCAARPGMQVLDFCAGAGGKTLALAGAMAGKGRIVAADTEAKRLEKAKLRFRRAGVSDIIEVRPLSDEKNRKWLRRQKGTFDIVLCDVPCSGTGTWRRNPDTRWRVYGPELQDLLPVQADILDRAAKAVKPGGRLVYATCSLLPEENEAQGEAFLARHTDFALLPQGSAWPDGVAPPCDGDYMRLTPRQHRTDGFFGAVFVRQAAAIEAAGDEAEEQ